MEDSTTDRDARISFIIIIITEIFRVA